MKCWISSDDLGAFYTLKNAELHFKEMNADGGMDGGEPELVLMQHMDMPELFELEKIAQELVKIDGGWVK